MTLSFMIKKKYLAQKWNQHIVDGTFHERREYKPFWHVRIGAPAAWRNNGAAVFLCGRHSFAADVLGIEIVETPDGIDDVVPGKLCYDIECRFLPSAIDRLSLFLGDNFNNDECD